MPLYTCKKRLHITYDQASFFVVVVFDIIEIDCISYSHGGHDHRLDYDNAWNIQSFATNIKLINDFFRAPFNHEGIVLCSNQARIVSIFNNYSTSVRWK